MITNREQHELAARAAGLVLTWKTGSCKGGDFEAAFVGDQPWRPKDDDGDALRLAVKLKMKVEGWFNGELECARADCKAALVSEPHNGDPYAAIRLAIFRAAVEIGKAMP